MMKALFSQITARRSPLAAQGPVELDEATGQVCTRSCRSAAHLDRVRTSTYRARL